LPLLYILTNWVKFFKEGVDEKAVRILKEGGVKMSFGRVYRSNLVEGMRVLVRGEGFRKSMAVTLKGNQYPGTKVRAFKTFGVAAALWDKDKVYLGTGVAPMATSGGVREPQAIGKLEVAQQHLALLQNWLNEKGVNLLDPFAVDKAVLELDETLARVRGLKGARPTSGIGSEVAIAATVALLDAQAAYYQIPTALAMRALLFSLQGKEPDVERLVSPLPKFNILNFGRHSGSKREDGLPYVWIQETKVAPLGAQSFEEAVFMGIEVLHKVIELAKVDNVGFEAGISPALTSPEEVYELAAEAIERTGLTGKVVIATDAAASEFSSAIKEGSDRFVYELYPGKKPLDAEGMVKFWVEMVKKYKIFSLEDGMNSEDFIGWRLLMRELGDKIEIQGDDLFVTDAQELKRLRDCANSILIKPNQAGTIVRTLRTIAAARKFGYTISPSHRSGKVPGGYGIIPELCLGTEAEWIKPGAPRRERQGFINNVITLVEELKLLGIPVGFAGPRVAQRFLGKS
jgi:enolase